MLSRIEQNMMFFVNSKTSSYNIERHVFREDNSGFETQSKRKYDGYVLKLSSQITYVTQCSDPVNISFWS